MKMVLGKTYFCEIQITLSKIKGTTHGASPQEAGINPNEKSSLVRNSAMAQMAPDNRDEA
jgi:hypothetical protein